MTETRSSTNTEATLHPKVESFLKLGGGGIKIAHVAAGIVTQACVFILNASYSCAAPSGHSPLWQNITSLQLPAVFFFFEGYEIPEFSGRNYKKFTQRH